MQIRMGRHEASKHNPPGWSLDDGKGERSFDHPVVFDPPLPRKPSVAVWLSKIDASKSAQIRLAVEARDISETGFTLVYRTWGDSHVYGSGCQWIAAL